MTPATCELLTGDGTPITVMRLSDGYFDATAMAHNARKRPNDYFRSKSASHYLQGLSVETGIPVSMLVQQKSGSAADQHTWVHPEVAVDFASWCCVEFKIKVNRLVVRYHKGEVTTEESTAAAESVGQALFGGSKEGVPPQLLAWHNQRDDARELNKAKSGALHRVTGGKAGGWTYARVNDAINRGVTGRSTKVLREQLKIRGTPRNRMGAAMLGAVAYQEGAIESLLERTFEGRGGFLKDGEASAVALGVTEKAHEFCKGTGGFALPMLEHDPPTVRAVQRALAQKKPSERQRTLLEMAGLGRVRALPAPEPAKTGWQDMDLYDAAPRAAA